jgi:hypothetical protein
MANYSMNHTKHINTLRRQQAKGFNAQAGGTYAAGCIKPNLATLEVLPFGIQVYTLSTAALPFLEAPLKSFLGTAARPAVVLRSISPAHKTTNFEPNTEFQEEPYVTRSEI